MSYDVANATAGYHCCFIAILCLLHYSLNREKLFSILRMYIVVLRILCALYHNEAQKLTVIYCMYHIFLDQQY